MIKILCVTSCGILILIWLVKITILLMISYLVGFMQSYRNPKRVSDRSCSLIDNIFSNITLPNAPSSDWVAGVFWLILSDHFKIFLNISCKLNSDIKHDLFVRNHSRYNTEKFMSRISRINWDTVYCKSNANSAYMHTLRSLKMSTTYAFPLLIWDVRANIP